jgi:hypothetical protein
MATLKSSALISVIGVFLTGGVFGVMVDRSVLVKSGPQPTQAMTLPPPNAPRPDPETVRKQRIDETVKEVNLDAKQAQELTKIYDETRDRFDVLRTNANAAFTALWEDQKTRTRAILRPDQIPLFDKLQERREAEQKARRPKEPHGPKSNPKG